MDLKLAITPLLPALAGDWARRWLVMLLGLAILLLASPVMAAPGLVAGEESSVTLIATDHGEKCHHDTRTAQPGDVALRGERHDSQEATPPAAPDPVYAPLFLRASTLGAPRARPDPSPLLLYLVTERFRS